MGEDTTPLLLTVVLRRVTEVHHLRAMVAHLLKATAALPRKIIGALLHSKGTAEVLATMPIMDLRRAIKGASLAVTVTIKAHSPLSSSKRHQSVRAVVAWVELFSQVGFFSSIPPNWSIDLSQKVERAFLAEHY
jgi:hypothetical protein